jgi:hypothetical protein
MRRGVAILLAAGLCAGEARAQLVVGSDQASGATIWLVDVTGARPARALVTGSAARTGAIAADEVGGRLWWVNSGTLYRAAYAVQGALAAEPVAVITGAPTAVTGLAFDTSAGRLIGRAGGGLYEIDTGTGAATQAQALAEQDFGGLDYDPGSDSFYAANDSQNTTVLPGRGLYRLAKPLGSAYTRLAGYPGGLTDVDGLAA